MAFGTNAISSLLRRPQTRRRLAFLAKFLLALIVLVIGFATAFQYFMSLEGRTYSWLSGVYWTLTTMTTLGFGDIVFESDSGRGFSIVVVLSGTVFMLVLLPFMFIRFIYEPWAAANAVRRVPLKVPETMNGHVILSFYGPVASALIEKLNQYNYTYVVLLPDETEVLALIDDGINAIYGNLDDATSYSNVRVESASALATTRGDIENTTVVFTVRGLAPDLPIFATAREPSAVEVLTLAGATRVLNLTTLMGRGLARRTAGGRKLTQIVGRIDDLLIAEVDTDRTTLLGMTLGDAQAATEISVVGIWNRGIFETGDMTTIIDPDTTLVMVGTSEQVKAFDNGFVQITDEPPVLPPVIIIGGGRVGRATASALQARGVDYRIIEELPERIPDTRRYVRGSAADRETLDKAGIDSAATVIITPRNDDLNVYLTIYVRLLRPDIQIISRATVERNVEALHRAGCDMVISYASMGSNALFNLLERSDVVMVAEGLDVFKVPVPETLVGKTLGEANIRGKTGCTVVGIDEDHETLTNPRSNTPFPAHAEIVLIGRVEGEHAFLREFGTGS